MTELFLLGAGASVDADVPDAYRMTREMLVKVSADPYSQYQRIDKLLDFVVGGLLFQQGIRGENPYDGVNIEDLFNAVLLLGDRQNSELGPFISSWHPKLVGLESGRLTRNVAHELLDSIYEPVNDYIKEFSKNLREAILDDVANAFDGYSINRFRSQKIDTFSLSDFESRFTEAVSQVMTGGEGELFKVAADSMILKLVEMVWITDSRKTDYLNPLVKYAKETSSTIATLNYDNAIELAGNTISIQVDTGFDSWSSSGEFTFNDSEVPLLKLHGSIDWALSDGETSNEKPLPFQVIRKVDMDEDKVRNFHPAVIFGGKNKLTARGPYLSLLRSFEQQLSNSENLTIIGYSFRDEHVNEFIANWFNGNFTRTIRIMNYKLNPSQNGLVEHLLSGHSNDRVQVINERAVTGIPRLMKTIEK